MATLQIPSLKMPEFLNKPPTGRLELDLVPLITMFACLPTLTLFWRKRRYMDLAAYGLGFFVAVVYHALHLAAHEGLAKVSFLGIHGAAWRTVDIVAANVLLARTMGHALNIDHPFIAVIPNAILPVTMLGMLFFVGDGAVGLPEVTRVTVVMMGVTLVLQLGQGGLGLLQYMGSQYSHPRAMRAVTSMACGIFAFTMPSRQPQNYWIWHSVWHVLMGLGYFDLYVHLIHTRQAQGQRQGSPGKTTSGSKVEAGSGGSRRGNERGDWYCDVADEWRQAVAAAKSAVDGLRAPPVREGRAPPAAAPLPVGDTDESSWNTEQQGQPVLSEAPGAGAAVESREGKAGKSRRRSRSVSRAARGAEGASGSSGSSSGSRQRSASRGRAPASETAPVPEGGGRTLRPRTRRQGA